MKFIAAVFVALAISAQADESEYNYYQTQHDQHQVDPYAGYSNDLNAGYTSAVSERQDFDMDVILPIVVFGGLGLGALAYIESLNFRNRLCNKLRDVTGVARDAAANGNLAAALADTNAVAPGNINNEANLNTIVNSNRLFINALAAIDDLDC